MFVINFTYIKIMAMSAAFNADIAIVLCLTTCKISLFC